MKNILNGCVLLALIMFSAGCFRVFHSRPGDDETKLSSCPDGACSGHGTCVNEGNLEKCLCDAEYRAEGLRCVLVEYRADIPDVGAGTPDVGAGTPDVGSDTPDVGSDTPDGDAGIAKGGPQVLLVSELLEALEKAIVPCVLDDGTEDGTTTIIERPELTTLADGAETLETAGSETRAWTGGASTVLLAYDPNSCGTEKAGKDDPEWDSAGLLIRGATLVHEDSTGEVGILLAPGSTVGDINLIDTDFSFASLGDTYGPTDDELDSYPNVSPSIDEAKRILIELAFPEE